MLFYFLLINYFLLKGHWYKVKVRGGLYPEIERQDDLLDRPVSMLERIQYTVLHICACVTSLSVLYVSQHD